jgi:hypothetical protein
MNRFKISFILLPLITATWSNSIESQDLHTTDVTQDLTTDPRVAKLVVDDVENFIRVQGLLASTSDTLETLQREYLDKGTPGLKMFIEKYDLTAERLLKAMRKYPDKYSSLHDLPDGIRAMEGEVHQAFTRLKEVIPQTMFPPTYFVVAGHRGIGSGSTEGPLVSVEKWSVPIEDETTMLIHEMVHIQQVMAVGYERYKALFGPEKSLLGLCIREQRNMKSDCGRRSWRRWTGPRPATGCGRSRRMPNSRVMSVTSWAPSLSRRTMTTPKTRPGPFGIS